MRPAGVHHVDLVVSSIERSLPFYRELLGEGDRLRLSELHLKADDPEAKAAALADVLDCESLGPDVEIGETLVRFVPGGPQGRPELHAELFI